MTSRTRMATGTPTSSGLSPAQSTSLSSASLASVHSSLSSAYAALASQSKVLASQSAIATGADTAPSSYKIVGILLALASGLFIGSSFVVKKIGLLRAQKKVLAAGGEAGESHEYLKNPIWWCGMIMMVIGEICNFVAYAFADAILVTPMGALSVVICAILSSIFLKERLTFFGKVGCFLCIVGSTVIALNGPEEQAVSTIKEFQHYFLAPGFLVFGSVIIVTALVLIFFVAPKCGKKNMLVYITVCSVIGGLSVVATQGLGASIVTSIKGNNQFKNWFIYFLIGFTVCTLLTEINFLNKALELFNTASVTPTYFVMFTFSTLVTSIILFQGLKAPVIDIITLVLGFLVVCSGIILLQMSKIDPAELSNKGLDRRSTLLMQATDKQTEDEKGLSAEDPGIDGLRGLGGVLGSVHRSKSARRSMVSRQELEERSEFRRRRRETLLSEGRSGVEMAPAGMKRHQLWDAPMPSDAADRISMHSGPRGDRSGTLSSQKDAPLPAIPVSPRLRAGTIRFDEAQVVGHEHHEPVDPSGRSNSFPRVQPFAPPTAEPYDPPPPSIQPSIRLATPSRSSTSDPFAFVYRDPYGDVDDRGPKSAPVYGPSDTVSPRSTRQRTDTNLTAGSARSWSRSLKPHSPRSFSFHRRETDPDLQQERESLVGSPEVRGRDVDSGANSDSDPEVVNPDGRDSGASSGSDSFVPVTHLDRP